MIFKKGWTLVQPYFFYVEKIFKKNTCQTFYCMIYLIQLYIDTKKGEPYEYRECLIAD